MIVGLIAITILILAVFGAHVARVQRRYKPLPQLRGDWWPQFERQFRAHVTRLARNKLEAS
jgi:hypothetical protein